MKQRKSTLLAATFLASLVLVACQTQQVQPTQQSSASHQVASGSAGKTAESTDENTTESPSSSTVQTPASAEKTVSETPTSDISASTLDLQSMTQGDFSSLVGTWSDADGNQFIIDAQGNVTNVYGETTKEGYMIQVTDASGKFLSGGLIAPNGSAVGSFMVIPAGVGTPNLGEVYDTDVICSGQSALAEKNPYRKLN